MKKRASFVLIIISFLLINVIFNFSIWKQLFAKSSNNINFSGDSLITLVGTEYYYQNLLKLKNPFIFEDRYFYPFNLNVSLSDPAIGTSFFYFFFRPFLDFKKSLLIVIIIDFFLNSFLMYLLLRRLKIRTTVAFISGLIYGYTPFLSYKVVNHYEYLPIYFFPLQYLIIYSFFQTKNITKKILFSVLYGILMAFILLSNFYYFFISILAIIFYIGYFLLTKFRETFRIIKESFLYIFLSISLSILLLIPWLKSVYQVFKNHEFIQPKGFGGAITFSADLVSFFTPSEYNPFYRKIFSFLSFRIPYFPKYNNFFLNGWDRFVYPGLIIILTFLIIIYLLVRKKLASNLWEKIKPHFFVSIIFAVLMLGPFLKVFNRWFINLDGVAVVIPLPFLILHYLPGLSTLRVPTRFTPVFVFLSLIVVAYVLNFIFEKINKKKQIVILVLLAGIFLFDQFYIIPKATNQYIPVKLYEYLKNQKNNKTVLEIPFTVRDGLHYIGFVHALQPMYGQAIHGKPIIGGYIARVPQKIFDYYEKLPFISYIAKIIDKGNYNPLTEKPKELVIYPYPYTIDTIRQELNSLNIKYILLKRDEKYSKYLYDLVGKVGFIDILKENNYILMVKK